MMVGTAMKQIARLFLVSLISLCFSQTTSAQITAVWDGTYWDNWLEWIWVSGGYVDTKILHRRFRVTSGSGYIDMTATLDVSGNLTTATTRMWVEEGIVYEADLWFDPFSGQDAYPGDPCYSIIFNSTASIAPAEYEKFPQYFNTPVPHWECPYSVTITTQDEIQLNASDGTFADHVRITWNEMQGATGYQVFRCTGAFHKGVGGYGEDSVCGEAIGSTQGNGFDDTGGIDENSYWYKVKVCTADDCGDFSKPDEGYRSDGQDDDHGNSCAEATPVDSNSTNQGIIENPGNWLWAYNIPERRDVDFFKIDLPTVASLTVNTTGSNSTSGTLWDAECTEISTSSDGGDGENFLINEELAIGTYYVSVGGGTGPYEFVSSFETTSALPGPPTQVYASDGLLYDRILISWTAVNLASAYNIYISDTLESSQNFAGQLSNPHGFITGTEPGVIRYIWIYPVNANGESATGNYDTGYAKVPTVPDAPTLNSAIPGDGEAVLSFAANGDGGSAITGYTASCGAINQAGTSSPITVSGLTNDTEYSCSVIASNAEGDSASSNALSVIPIRNDLIHSDGFEAKTN